MPQPTLAKALVGLGLVALPLSSAAAGLGEKIAKQGNGKGAAACQTCHGADGAGNGPAGYPRLAGMDAGYIVKQLKDLAGDSRQNAIMKPMASALTEKERQAVADYYAGMEAPAEAPGAGGDKQQIATGKAIAEDGLWRKGVPACTSCHGPGGQGVGSSFPGLAGQHANYITNQIQAWQSDKRSNDPNQLMDVVAERLTEEEAAAAAAYFASLPAASQD
jgi:cytochrome c553